MPDSPAEILELILSVVFAVLASSGFWMYMTKRSERKSNSTQLLLGLAHDRIVYLCLKFLDAGRIGQDEYENLYEYLYKPYSAMGGNGTAQKLMEDVKKLPIVKQKQYRDTGELKQ